jgi:hypothetical protein
LIEKQQRVHRRDFKLLPARLTHDLVVDTDQVITQFGELRAIALIAAGRKPILFRPPHPANGIVVRAPASWARQTLGAVFVAIEEKRALI